MIEAEESRMNTGKIRRRYFPDVRLIKRRNTNNFKKHSDLVAEIYEAKITLKI